MKRLFYLGLVALVLFEVAKVYFITPLPYSQRVPTVDLAYLLHTWRWVFRVGCGAFIVAGARGAWKSSKWKWPVLAVLVVAAIVSATNFALAFDRIFLAPNAVVMAPANRNVVAPSRLVIGIEILGEARAYPVQFIGYHHQVHDWVGSTAVLVSYCTLCRTSRVFSPVVDGKVETFRLVGTDHFNAMFEDKTTKSWWRQATGDAVVGPRKGRVLEEIPSQLMTLEQWTALHPRSLIMQPDSALRGKYSKSFDYEIGKRRSLLTGADPVSWSDMALVVGVVSNGVSKAYDWNRLRKEGVINDTLGGTPIVLALAADGASFFAFSRPNFATTFVRRGDSLVAGDNAFAFTGHGPSGSLEPIQASQEFWRSWRTFHRATGQY